MDFGLSPTPPPGGAAATAAPLVVVSGLSKSYGPREAIRDISFTVEKGTVLGLLGPNGSGKSTILRTLTGYQAPSGGTVTVQGNDVSTKSLAARRNIGYVPEDIPLYPNMQVREFLRFMASMRGVARGEVTSAVDIACSRLSLGSIIDISIGKLSRGYRQRVAIAQALLGDPPLLVLDEPTNGLDPRQIIDMRNLIRELAREHTIIVSSHILSEIEQVATHVAILLNGNLLTCERLQANRNTRWCFEVPASQVWMAERTASRTIGVLGTEGGPVGDAGSVGLTIELADVSAAAVVATALVGAGIELRRMEPIRSRLEDIFMAATSGNAETLQ